MTHQILLLLNFKPTHNLHSWHKTFTNKRTTWHVGHHNIQHRVRHHGELCNKSKPSMSHRSKTNCCILIAMSSIWKSNNKHASLQNAIWCPWLDLLCSGCTFALQQSWPTSIVRWLQVLKASWEETSGIVKGVLSARVYIVLALS